VASVSIRNVKKRFDQVEVIHGLDLEIAHQEFVVLVGPSGCGKSTMLRMIAELEDVSDGEIWIGERKVNNVEPKARNIAMVFQNYALYPHMTVFRNIAFGLRAAKLPKAQVEIRVREAAEILELSELLQRRPAELSGGQRQRVAMGRAIVREPEVFLFDEPLSNLDAQLRSQMRTEITKLHQKVRTTVIYVTHDQVEAMTLADRIVIMRDGYIQQIGTPTEVYEAPANMFVAQFIGSPAMNMLKASVTAQNGGLVLSLEDGTALPVPARANGRLTAGTEVIAGIRPDDLFALRGTTVGEGQWPLSATASVVEPLGPESLVHATIAGQTVIAKAHGRDVPAVGEALTFACILDHLHVFDATTEQAIC